MIDALTKAADLGLQPVPQLPVFLLLIEDLGEPAIEPLGLPRKQVEADPLNLLAHGLSETVGDRSGSDGPPDPPSPSVNIGVTCAPSSRAWPGRAPFASGMLSLSSLKVEFAKFSMLEESALARSISEGRVCTAKA